MATKVIQLDDKELLLLVGKSHGAMLVGLEGKTIRCHLEVVRSMFGKVEAIRFIYEDQPTKAAPQWKRLMNC